MTPKEWAAICALMTGIWHRPIGPVEQAAGLRLLGSLDRPVVEGAVVTLAKSGAERIPTWAALYGEARAIEADMRPALPPPDLTRDLTPEEHERARRRSAELKQRVDAMAESKALEPLGAPFRVKLLHSHLPKVKPVDDTGKQAS